MQKSNTEVVCNGVVMSVCTDRDHDIIMERRCVVVDENTLQYCSLREVPSERGEFFVGFSSVFQVCSPFLKQHSQKKLGDVLSTFMVKVSSMVKESFINLHGGGVLHKPPW
jgi:hypothetical protein